MCAKMNNLKDDDYKKTQEFIAAGFVSSYFYIKIHIC